MLMLILLDLSVLLVTN